ncbi:hypothetical protein FY557_15990 [Chryseobacterium sp. SN22]|uniref:hypothetical protein n=1 Tax=Chryseobacterium sp. SN22 TaxID=2606431 RepID=UPI0011EF1036|nr:hypothetical protein [Chryseobacterium sp. SN22]KAA0126802.1 hypothetical protein FY557_15990 [Chryseobacterium sp. SN22]
MASDLNEIKKDLRSLAGYLGNWGKYVKNHGMLNNINCHSSGGQIHYSIEKVMPLVFQDIDIERHVIPQGIDCLCRETERFFEVELTIRLSQINEPSDLQDPIKRLGVAIKIEGEYLSNDIFEKAICSWHLDKGDSSTSLFTHPTYHLNFGGDHMANKITEEANPKYYGGLLLLPAPRVLHPPMDIILSCDFIIKNFYEKSKHHTLTSLPGYKDLLEKAKSRFIRPYIYALGSTWNSDLTISNLSHNSAFGH